MSRWDKLEELFARAQPLATAARGALLDAECAGDAALRAEVEALLATSDPEHELGIERLAPAERPDPIVGSVIDRWRVIELVGRGGMASVYRAERADGEYQQQAALKLISPATWTRETADRFRTERQVLAQLSHPNIARLLDGGLTGAGVPYLIMELVDGAPITEWCAAREVAVPERLRLFRVVCEAVQHAHGMLVVHRDLKPANTFVTAAGEVKLLDFGIAKLLAPAAFGVDPLATIEHSSPLTPEYAAPEQLFGGVITTASDVYSLGVLLYELLTGARPFRLAGKTLVESEREIMTAAIAPPARRLGVPRADDLDCIVLTALRAQPERRYVSAGQLADDIGRYLEGRPVHARRDTLAYRARRFIGRNRVAVAAIAAFALSLVGFGIVALWQARRAAAERDAAQVERDKAEKVVGLLVELFETSNPTLRPEQDKLSIRQFLAQAEPHTIERLADEPVVRARMRQVFGLIHAARDEMPEAQAAMEQALKEQRALLGPDAPATIESLYHLGTMRARAGDEEGARAILQEVLERSLRVFGENDDRTARVLVALCSEHHLDEARGFLERALAIRRRVLPPNDPQIAYTLGQLAQYYWLTGDTARARQVYAEALATFRTPAERHNETAIDLLNASGVLLGELKAYAEAEAALRESIELSKIVYGPDSLKVAQAMHNLAVHLIGTGKQVDGEQVLRATFERHRAVLGEDHWETINIGRDVAILLALAGRYEEALSWFDRELAAEARCPGEHDTMRYHMLAVRAILLVRLGRASEAVEAVTSALATAKSPPISKDMMAAVRLYGALVHLETGHPERAEPLARLAMPDAHDAVAALAKILLGWSLVATDRVAEGRALMTDGLPAYRAWPTADPYAVAEFDRVLAKHAK
jgi:eukaryotic-like serine/threonine-protein kinase